MHRFDEDPIGHRLQVAELEYLASSEAAQTAMAEIYVGLAFEDYGEQRTVSF